MPRVISVNNHRFSGPNLFHNAPNVTPGAMVSPGILVNMFPTFSGIGGTPGTGSRYNLVTDTATVESYPYGTYPNLEGSGMDSQFRKGAFCSLGGGFGMAIRIDTATGADSPVRTWIYSDATRAFSTINPTPSVTLPIGSSAPNIGLHQLGDNLAFFQVGTQGFVYNRISNTWSATPTMPREVRAAAYYGEGLLYLVGRQLIDGSYRASTSFTYNRSTNTFTELNHTLNVSALARLEGIGVIGIGTDNWQIYNVNTNSILIRPRAQAANSLLPVRTSPAAYWVNNLTVYSY